MFYMPLAWVCLHTNYSLACLCPPPPPKDWEHLEAFTVQTQSGSSPKLQGKQIREPGKSEQGSLRPTRDLPLMFLCSGMGVLWGKEIHLSADSMLCLFGITRDTIIHAMDLSHGLLSFCLWEGLCSDLKLHIQIFQDLIFTSLLKLVSCFPGSDLPVHPVCLERALSPSSTWKGTSSPRDGLLSHGPFSGTSFGQWK